ncbi:unnamed protein product [Angiostrongylus costaricensis]|uniref:G protein-coupled receptor n=1 Tax=Angiostrongylus costaricensis TaxID=334426 RepID=A0A0R3PUU4_ANGCS|nr:unnamed protein product [Angiostrongylus costaricensis]
MDRCVHGQTFVDENADAADSSTVACSEVQIFSGVTDGVGWMASSRYGQAHAVVLYPSCLYDQVLYRGLGWKCACIAVTDLPVSAATPADVWSALLAAQSAVAVFFIYLSVIVESEVRKCRALSTASKNVRDVSRLRRERRIVRKVMYSKKNSHTNCLQDKSTCSYSDVIESSFRRKGDAVSLCSARLDIVARIACPLIYIVLTKPMIRVDGPRLLFVSTWQLRLRVESGLLQWAISSNEASLLSDALLYTMLMVDIMIMLILYSKYEVLFYFFICVQADVSTDFAFLRVWKG